MSLANKSYMASILTNSMLVTLISAVIFSPMNTVHALFSLFQIMTIQA